MQRLFNVMLEAMWVWFKALFLFIRLGVVYMIIFLIEAKKFITVNYNIIYWIIIGVAMIGLLFLETKTKKILSGELTREECKKIQIRGNRLRDICITLCVLVSLIAEKYAGAVILLVVEIMMLRVGNSRLEREVERQIDLSEAKEKMFIFEIKHIAKIMRGEIDK